MNERKILEKLSYDISEIELPPISEKVLQAVREKSESCSQTNEDHVKPVKTHKMIQIKYAFAAMIAFFVLYLPIIVVLSNNSFSSVITKESDISNNSNSAVSKSDTPNEKNNPSVLEKIKLKEVYGTVALTKRTEKECEMYLMNYAPGNSVYEDDNYLYNFDSDGNLVEILNTRNQSALKVELNESEIKKKAENIFDFYLSTLNREYYKISVQDNKGAFPAWTVDFIKVNDNIVNENIRMTFNKSGMLYMLVSTPAATEVGNISKMEAIEIALNEIRSNKYDLPEFDKKGVRIKIESQKTDRIYIVTVDSIPTIERDILESIIVIIDSNSGNILNLKKL